MTKRSIFEGFELRGRSHFHPYLNGYPLEWTRIPNILRYRKGEEIRIGKWVFSLPYGMLYLSERKKWRTEYCPPSGLRNKKVLDIGAGCGESAKFFIDSGVRHVIAVENDKEALTYLRRNAETFDKISVVGEAFNPERDLAIPNIDLVKCDIEGYEIYLAQWLEKHPSFNVDMIIECHSTYQCDLFFNLGFNQIADPTWGVDPPWGIPTSARTLTRWARKTQIVDGKS